MEEEAAMSDISLDELLAPLFEAMDEYRLSRLVVYPGSVTGDGLGGMGSLEVDWTEEIHQELISVLDEPVALDNGATLEAVGGQIVVRLEPDVSCDLPGLVEAGMLSKMASDFLSASLVLGKNILITGPNQATIPFCTALLADGERPAVMGLEGMLAPAHWPVLCDLGEVHVLGPDRLGMWCCPTETVVEIMAASSSVISCIPGGFRDKALRRINNAMLAVGMPGESEALLSAVDLVISLGWNEGFRVQEIAEIVPAASGCEHRVLFESGDEEAPTALIPLYRPSYLSYFLNLGIGPFVDSLRRATVEPTARIAVIPESIEEPKQSYDLPEPEEFNEEAYDLGEPEVSSAPQVDVDLSRTMPTRPTYSPDSIDSGAEPPGWELDQLPSEGADGGPAAAPTSEDAVMAAAYGLAPPPRPGGVKIENNPNFQKALQEAKVRDEAFRRQQEGLGTED